MLVTGVSGKSEQGDDSAAAFGERLGHILALPTQLPSWWMLLITISAGVMLSLPSSRLRQANLLGLLVHEAGHELASLLAGGRVHVIELAHPDAGKTWTSEEPGFRQW